MKHSPVVSAKYWQCEPKYLRFLCTNFNSFTARRYALARSLLSPGVCPSVCLSRWCIVSRRLKISSNFFADPVAPSFKFSDPQRRYPIPRRTSSAGAQNTRSWENFAFFDWNRRVSRKRYEIGPWLLWNVNRKSYALYWMVTFSMTVAEP